MPKKKKTSLDVIDFFDDDFEVSYEEENPFNYKLETPPSKKKSKKENGLNVVNIKNGSFSNEDKRGPKLLFNSKAYNKPKKASKIQYELEYDDYYDDDLDDDYDDDDYDDEISYSRRRNTGTPLAAPLKEKILKIYDVIYGFMRNLSLLLILTIIVLLIVNFLRGSALYGDIYEEMKSQQFSLQLVSYFAVAACLIIYELFAALWTMSKTRVWDEYGPYRVDAGRGLSTFLFIYIGSYASFIISNYIPELNEVFYGIRGALTVFGSMHNVLFWICLTGIISCLIRKYRL